MHVHVVGHVVADELGAVVLALVLRCGLHLLGHRHLLAAEPLSSLSCPILPLGRTGVRVVGLQWTDPPIVHYNFQI